MNHHHKIMHHIQTHISKHHKKYIFGAGMAIGLFIVKIIAIISIFLGIHMTIGKSEAGYARAEMQEAMQIFEKIHTIAEEEIKESEEEGNPFNEEQKNIFNELNKKYHCASNLTEKFRTSKKMADFLSSLEATHHIDGEEENSDEERDEEFYELLEEFNRLR